MCERIDCRVDETRKGERESEERKNVRESLSESEGEIESESESSYIDARDLVAVVADALSNGFSVVTPHCHDVVRRRQRASVLVQPRLEEWQHNYKPSSF